MCDSLQGCFHTLYIDLHHLTLNDLPTAKPKAANYTLVLKYVCMCVTQTLDFKAALYYYFVPAANSNKTGAKM